MGTIQVAVREAKRLKSEGGINEPSPHFIITFGAIFPGKEGGQIIDQSNLTGSSFLEIKVEEVRKRAHCCRFSFSSNC